MNITFSAPVKATVCNTEVLASRIKHEGAEVGWAFKVNDDYGDMGFRLDGALTNCMGTGDRDFFTKDEVKRAIEQAIAMRSHGIVDFGLYRAAESEHNEAHWHGGHDCMCFEAGTYSRFDSIQSIYEDAVRANRARRRITFHNAPVVPVA